MTEKQKIEAWLEDSEYSDYISFDWDGSVLEISQSRDKAPVELSREELIENGVELASETTDTLINQLNNIRANQKRIGDFTTTKEWLDYGKEIALQKAAILKKIEKAATPPGKKKGMTVEEEIEMMITEQLADVCETNLPRLCEFVKSPEGKETARNMIFSYCKQHGVSIQSAMAHIDSEL